MGTLVTNITNTMNAALTKPDRYPADEGNAIVEGYPPSAGGRQAASEHRTGLSQPDCQAIQQDGVSRNRAAPADQNDLAAVIHVTRTAPGGSCR